MFTFAKLMRFFRPTPRRRNFAIPAKTTPRVLKDFRSDRHAALALIRQHR